MHGELLAVSYFFFLMIRRPPRSTLFPYRRSSDHRHDVHPAVLRGRRTEPETVEDGIRGGLRAPRHSLHAPLLDVRFPSRITPHTAWSAGRKILRDAHRPPASGENR